MFIGWDYTEEPKEVCDCRNPKFDKNGICELCERPMPGVTLDVQNASITVSNKIYFTGEKHG